jgi:organic hydroperoxide reductase OsmC/OhrA
VPSANETSFQTRVRWAGSHAPGPLGPRSYTRDLLVEPEGKPPIAGSASARYFGDDARYNPEDLMLASLGECHLLTYLALAAKAGIRVTALRAVVTGTLGKIEGKVRFREATLHVTTEIDGDAGAEPRGSCMRPPTTTASWQAPSTSPSAWKRRSRTPAARMRPSLCPPLADRAGRVALGKHTRGCNGQVALILPCAPATSDVPRER